jgi:tRNA dimethylallyltransferase
MSAVFNCIVVLGPTASGKTQLAVTLATELNGAIISVDSRQVYQQLNIGTGKDLQEYQREGKNIPYHLIDLVPAGQQFFLHEFVAELDRAFETIISQKQVPIICGGTGLYLDAIQTDYRYTSVPENEALRLTLSSLTKEQLQEQLLSFPESVRKHVDQHSVKRLIRGIEIATYLHQNKLPELAARPNYKPYYIGLSSSVEQRKEKIHTRLLRRIDEGLIKEAEELLSQGLSHERLQRLGLEYKFLSYFLLGQITKSQMIADLETAIVQYAKRQMTWFRKMERSGVEIHWRSADSPVADLIESIRKKISF